MQMACIRAATAHAGRRAEPGEPRSAIEAHGGGASIFAIVAVLRLTVLLPCTALLKLDRRYGVHWQAPAHPTAASGRSRGHCRCGRLHSTGARAVPGSGGSDGRAARAGGRCRHGPPGKPSLACCDRQRCIHRTVHFVTITVLCPLQAHPSGPADVQRGGSVPGRVTQSPGVLLALIVWYFNAKKLSTAAQASSSPFRCR